MTIGTAYISYVQKERADAETRRANAERLLYEQQKSAISINEYMLKNIPEPWQKKFGLVTVIQQCRNPPKDSKPLCSVVRESSKEMLVYIEGPVAECQHGGRRGF